MGDKYCYDYFSDTTFSWKTDCTRYCSWNTKVDWDDAEQMKIACDHHKGTVVGGNQCLTFDSEHVEAWDGGCIDISTCESGCAVNGDCWTGQPSCADLKAQGEQEAN